MVTPKSYIGLKVLHDVTTNFEFYISFYQYPTKHKCTAGVENRKISLHSHPIYISPHALALASIKYNCIIIEILNASDTTARM